MVRKPVGMRFTAHEAILIATSLINTVFNNAPSNPTETKLCLCVILAFFLLFKVVKLEQGNQTLYLSAQGLLFFVLKKDFLFFLSCRLLASSSVFISYRQ